MPPTRWVRRSEFRDLGLLQVGYACQFIAKQRAKRSVFGELALEGFLRGIFDHLDSMMITEVSAGVTISSELAAFVPQISKFEILLSNDVTARVQLLERGTCP